MNTGLIRALSALVPSGLLLSGSVVLFIRRRTICTLLQVLGSVCLITVAVTHICEALRLFPWMHWGLEHSAGHYLDLASAVLGLTLFPMVTCSMQPYRGVNDRRGFDASPLSLL